MTVAEAQVEFAQAVLDNYTLHAPYDALVVARNLQLGSMPVPGQVVFTLVDPTTIWVLGYVDERQAGAIELGQSAEITLRSEPGRRYPRTCGAHRDTKRCRERGEAGRSLIRQDTARTSIWPNRPRS